MAGRHRLFPNVFGGGVYRPKVYRRPQGLSGHLPKHARGEGYWSVMDWGRR